MTVDRFAGCEVGGRRLCALSASRWTVRFWVAASGREGWVLLVKNWVKETLEVVGRVKGNGMLDVQS